MQDTDALLDALAHTGEPRAVAAVADLVRNRPEGELVRINALQFAAARGLDEDAAIAAFLHGSRLGLFEMSWNVLCPSCGGVLDENATLKTVRHEDYYCSFCELTSEPRLDDRVEVTYTASPRVRRLAAHDEHSLKFWDYYRHVFFGSGVELPEPARFESLARECLLESAELQPGERMILSLQLPLMQVMLCDPVTHASYVFDVVGEPTAERQDLSIVFDGLQAAAGRVQFRPGPVRLSLDNRSQTRVLPGVFAVNPAFEELMGGRRPFLTAKRLLCNQTFRDVYRTDTLAVDQRLKITSLTFLFTDLKGSTELYERVGDLVAYDLVRSHFRVLHDVVASEAGAVVKTIGDAVMATFPAPKQAMSAALRMRDAMRDLNAERPAGDLVLKIGLHEGPCLAVSLNDRQDYFGQTVNIAARVQDLATSDGVFATTAVVQQVDTAALLAERGLVVAARSEGLRGIGGKLPVFEVVAGPS